MEDFKMTYKSSTNRFHHKYKFGSTKIQNLVVIPGLTPIPQTLKTVRGFLLTGRVDRLWDLSGYLNAYKNEHRIDF